MTNFARTRILLTTAATAAICAAPVAFAASGGLGPGGSESGGGNGGGSGTAPAGSDGVFPVVGAHTYGDGLGAGRGHQGQDVMAKCGKPLVAAQGGRVQVVDYHSAAGNYVVIKSDATRIDHVYMHLIAESPVNEGQRVRTGQKIGRVGNTGNSSACHLHFEMWSSPGWYKGGSVLNPTPQLKAWDRGPGR